VAITAVGIDSNFEPQTKVACEYRVNNVYPYLQTKGLNVVTCQGPMARRTYVAPAVKQAGVELITGVGHGDSDTFMGDWYDPVFHIGDYSSDEVSGKIVHFLSCYTAQNLGPDFVKNQCLAYFGYDAEFLFDPDSPDVFFECDSEIDLAFADGQAAQQAYDRAVKLFDDRAAKANAAGQLYTAARLQYDRDHLCCPASGSKWGDTTARIK
jgi:hypothetical protein